MRKVRLRTETYDTALSRRRLYQDYFLVFHEHFFYNDTFWKAFFMWYFMGRANEGLHRATFYCQATDVVLHEVAGSDVPYPWHGWSGTSDDNPLFTVGILTRFEYNQGRCVYRAFPNGLRTRFTEPCEYRVTACLSDEFWSYWNGTLKPWYDREVTALLGIGEGMHIAQKEHPERFVTKIEPIGVTVEQRFWWL